MARIPCTVRIAGRYVYRRRVHLRNLISKHLPVALQTADPLVARGRAALLSARFILVKMSVETMLADDRTSLTGTEIEALFRHELEQELSRNLADAFSNASYSSSVAEAARPLAEAYRMARRPDRPQALTEADRSELEKRGFKRGLMSLPVGFRFGTSTSGAMSRPFAEAVAALPPIEREAVRNPKTVNRDLSTMSTVAKHLATTA